MSEPTIAGTKSIQVELEEGKNYFFCACGESKNQPFCDGSHSLTPFQPIMFTAEKTGPAWLCACKRSEKLPFCDGTHKQYRETEESK